MDKPEPNAADKADAIIANNLTHSPKPADGVVETPFETFEERTYFQVLSVFKGRFFCSGDTILKDAALKTRELAKILIRRTREERDLRKQLGESEQCWSLLREVLSLGLKNSLVVFIFEVIESSKERLVLGDAQPNLIEQHCNVLSDNLHDLGNILMIARNILSTSREAQDISHGAHVGYHVMQIIDILSRAIKEGDCSDSAARQPNNKRGRFKLEAKKVLKISFQLLHHLLHNNDWNKSEYWKLWTEEPDAHAKFGLRKAPQSSAEYSIVFMDDPSIHRMFMGPLAAYPVMLTVKHMSSDVTDQWPEIRVPNVRAFNIKHREYNRNTTGPYSWSPINKQMEELVSLTKDRKDFPGLTTVQATITARKLKQKLVNTVNIRVQQLAEAKTKAKARAKAKGPSEPNVCNHGHGEAPARVEAAICYPPLGLLAELPIVCIPEELQPLLMMIMTATTPVVQDIQLPGIALVDQMAKDNYVAQNILQNYRLEMMLQHERGRKLLEQLLIWVVLWGDNTHDIHCRMFYRVIRALIDSGLVPYASESFKEVRQLVTLPQNSLLKMVLCVYEDVENFPKQTLETEKHRRTNNPPRLQEVDVLLLRYFFRSFRNEIIPGFVAIVHLQAHILNGKLEDELEKHMPFTANEMAHTLEGLLTYLHFFEYFCSGTESKKLLADWQLTFDLVTLILELNQHMHRLNFADEQMLHASERSIKENDPTPDLVDRRPTYPGAFANPTFAAKAGSTLDFTPESDDECAEYTWPNLKRTAIEVLTALMAGSRRVQDDLRMFGGIDAILNSMIYDGYNPMIQQRAILCIRYALDNNTENQKLVSDLKKLDKMAGRATAALAAGALPSEVEKLMEQAQLAAIDGPETLLNYMEKAASAFASVGDV